VIVAMMLAPTAIHFGLVDKRMDSQRFFGLLPSHLLCLRFLAQLSGCGAILAFIAFISTYVRPSCNVGTLAVGFLAFFVFAISYLCYALVIVALLLSSRVA
jgi:hypothetical protein